MWTQVKKLRAAGELPQALPILARLCGLNPSRVVYFIAYADALIGSGRLAEAERTIAHAVEIDPRHPEAGKVEQRLLAAQAEAARNSKTEQLRLWHEIKRLRAAGLSEQAIPLLSRLRRLDPDHPPYVLAHADTFLSAGRLDLAEALVARGLELAPENPEARKLEARLRAEQARREAGPTEDQIWVMVKKLRARQDFRRAVPLLRELCARRPDHPPYLLALTESLIEVRRNADAAPLLKRAQELSPNNPDALRLERQLEPPLAFIHIPRTAGTSLHAAIQERYGLTSYFIKESRTTQEIFEHIPPTIDILHGHMPYGVHMWRPVRYATLLRDPIDRVLSHYRLYAYQKRYKGLEPEPLSVSAEKSMLRNVQAKMIAGIPADADVEVASDELVLELAKMHLVDFYAIGFFDNLQAFAAKLGIFAGIPEMNRLEVESPPAEEDVAQLRANNQVDIELYRWARERFA